MIRFKLLGEIGLWSADASPIDTLLRQPKRLALLAYLVTPLPGTWHRRDILTALFWPELDSARTRNSLRNALHVLRQCLGEDVVLTRGDEEVSINPARLQTDLGQVSAALRDGRGEALEHYQGELLPGLFPPDSEGFQRWLEQERSRLRSDVSRAGTRWAEALRSEGRMQEALAAVRRAIEINPDDETAVRLAMSIYDSLGDRAGGLNAYEEYRRRLDRDFGGAPARETVALADQLRRLQLPASGPTPTVASADPAIAAASPMPLRARRSGLPALGGAALTLAALILGFRTINRPREPAAIGTSRPLTFEEGLQIEPSISPDGRQVAYVKGNSRRMRIFVQSVAGGPPRPLTDDSGAIELLPRWSPDNKWIVFLSRNGAYVSPTKAGPPRLVAAGGDGDAMVRSAAWSPDGDSLVIVRNDSLRIQPLEGSGGRLVGTGNQLHSCVWESHRRWIACVSGNWVAYTPGPLFGNRAPSSIVLYPVRGGTGVNLTDREKEYYSPAWSDDGRFLWVLSNRDGTPGEVYAIAVGRNGARSGPYVRIGLNAESLSLTRGAVAWSVPARKANIWSVPIPSRPPETLASANRVTSGNQVIEVISLSRDGRWLVYDSNLRGNSDIYRTPAAGGPTERQTDDAREEFAGQLSPDNGELAYHMWVGGERHLFVKALEEGSVQPVITEPGDWGVPQWAPAGTSLAAWSHQREEGAISVVHRDSTGRWQPPAWKLANAQLPVWSPDGKAIAFVQLAGSVGVVSADSGPTTILYAPRPGSRDPVATYLLWGGDPDELVFLGHYPDGRGGIWALPIRGGKPRLLVDFEDRISGPSIASDGQRFFFTLDERLSNIRWAELTTR